MIEPGTPAPDFALPNHKGAEVGLGDFRGRWLVLCFYPNDFSPVCSDQLSIYQEVLGQLHERGAELVGISTDGTWTHNAFRKLVLIDPEGVVRWVHESPTPLEIPGANLIFDALEAYSD
jgi:peroxiredoxin